MALLKLTSPHAHSAQNTARVMQLVILATIPGLFALTLFFGWGSLINVTLSCMVAVGCEALVIRLRKRPIMFYLKDYSAILTAVLLGISLPPLAPWWIAVVGTSFAIIIAKNLYGGLGYNPFNPAMIGYVVLLISFPVQMTAWPAPAELYPSDMQVPGLWHSIQIVLPLLNPDTLSGVSETASGTIDAYTAATPLDTFKQNTGLLVDQFYKKELFFSQGTWAGLGWEWVNIGFLLGGLFLLYRKIFTWHAPLGMLLSLALCSVIFYDSGSSSSLGSPLFHLLSGATMFGAFFIITDPVTSATSNKGRLIYGALIGVLIFIIRSWGSYPDAIAFAVLLMNFAAPLIDNYTMPRTYGYSKSGVKSNKKRKEDQSDAR
ncbi:MAG: electron transport complex subunit RsxD [Porticoccus sp.]|jgi:electron transport complex protein RnfD|nr:electron transport complex subunit RsxD [Porticoccus sp.]